MLIFIPTRGRVGYQYTARAIPSEWKGETIVVCPSEEAKEHRKHGLKTLPFDTVGISPKRQFILEWAHKRGHEKILMLDDDLVFFEKGKPRDKKSKTPFSLYEVDEVGMDDLFIGVENALHDYALVGIDTREGCQNHEDGTHNIRITRATAYRVDILMGHKVRFDHVNYMQDFDVILQLAKLGYPSRVLPKYVQNHARASNATGGCSLHRTNRRKREAAIALAKRHAPFVKLVEKKAWKGMSEGMVDVLIQWKKAHAHGVATHGDKFPLL